MFKIKNKRYTYDIGNNNQFTENNSYPAIEEEKIKPNEKLIKEGDDLSTLTKFTLSSYLSALTIGAIGPTSISKAISEFGDASVSSPEKLLNLVEDAVNLGESLRRSGNEFPIINPINTGGSLNDSLQSVNDLFGTEIPDLTEVAEYKYVKRSQFLSNDLYKTNPSVYKKFKEKGFIIGKKSATLKALGFLGFEKYNGNNLLFDKSQDENTDLLDQVKGIFTNTSISGSFDKPLIGKIFDKPINKIDPTVSLDLKDIIVNDPESELSFPNKKRVTLKDALISNSLNGFTNTDRFYYEYSEDQRDKPELIKNLIKIDSKEWNTKVIVDNKKYNRYLNENLKSNYYKDDDIIITEDDIIENAKKYYGEEKFLPFYFQDLRNNKFIAFHAFLDSLSDSFSPSYDTSESIGRIEPIYNYKSTTRKISLSFSIISSNPNDFEKMWDKLNAFLMLVYPSFSKGRFLSDAPDTVVPFTQIPAGSPIVRMRVGDLIKSNISIDGLRSVFNKKNLTENEITKYFLNASKGLAGVIDNIDYSFENYTWSIEKNSQAPKRAKVSIGFTVIHDILPGLDIVGNIRTRIYKIGEISETKLETEATIATIGIIAPFAAKLAPPADATIVALEKFTQTADKNIGELLAKPETTTVETEKKEIPDPLSGLNIEGKNKISFEVNEIISNKIKKRYSPNGIEKANKVDIKINESENQLKSFKKLLKEESIKIDYYGFLNVDGGFFENYIEIKQQVIPFTYIYGIIIAVKNEKNINDLKNIFPKTFFENEESGKISLKNNYKRIETTLNIKLNKNSFSSIEDFEKNAKIYTNLEII